MKSILKLAFLVILGLTINKASGQQGGQILTAPHEHTSVFTPYNLGIGNFLTSTPVLKPLHIWTDSDAAFRLTSNNSGSWDIVNGTNGLWFKFETDNANEATNKFGIGTDGMLQGTYYAGGGLLYADAGGRFQKLNIGTGKVLGSNRGQLDWVNLLWRMPDEATLSPELKEIHTIKLTNSDEFSKTLTRITAANDNDEYENSGAVLEAKGSGKDNMNNVYLGKYGDNYRIPTWRGNGVLATDQDLIIASVGQTDEKNPNFDPRIIFQTGNSYDNLQNRMVLNENGFLGIGTMSPNALLQILESSGKRSGVIVGDEKRELTSSESSLDLYSRKNSSFSLNSYYKEDIPYGMNVYTYDGGINFDYSFAGKSRTFMNHVAEKDVLRFFESAEVNGAGEFSSKALNTAGVLFANSTGVGINSAPTEGYAVDANGTIRATKFEGVFSGTFEGQGASQWQDVSEGIAYNAGSIGIGTDAPESDIELKRKN